MRPPHAPCAPRVWTIPGGAPFLETLCRGLIAQTADDPLSLSAMTLFLPTRRATLAAHDAFLRVREGRATILPRLLALGDFDEDLEGMPLDLTCSLPPPLPPLQRQFLLMQLILKQSEFTPAGAFAVAGDLGSLLDEFTNHGRDLADLDGLVAADYAQHWQITLDFLEVIRQHWSKIIEATGACETAMRRNRLFEAQVQRFCDQPPDSPVIIAGATGSIPATQALIKMVANLPQGAVILPGLDTSPSGGLSPGPTHPQYLLRRLLAHLAIDPEQVPVWPAARAALEQPGRQRVALITAALAPAEAETPATIPDLTTLANVMRLDCQNPHQEAGVIALLLRETLETPGATAALVTPDRALARRVIAELARWNIAIDDSAGTPLLHTPAAMFLRLIIEAVAADFAPPTLLALLKHPLLAAGCSPAQARRYARLLDRKVLRGPRPAAGFAGVQAALASANLSDADHATLGAWLSGLEQRCQPVICDEKLVRPAEAQLRDHLSVAERLATTDTLPGADRLWAEASGEAAAKLLADILEAATALPEMEARHYPAFFTSLLAGAVVRPTRAFHPRLAIWGLLEARLQQVDRMILGGLNEGCWPAEPPADPWLSRPMRAQLGLPPPEERIGQAAHDFVQAFGAERIILTRSQRVDGAPTVPSRWLQRLDSCLKTQNDPPSLTRYSQNWLDWQIRLDQPCTPLVQYPPPAPRPPVAARPRRLSVTEISTWMRDPYAIYARHILKLRALEPLDADLGAADRGSLLHDALDLFVEACPAALPEDALARLLECGRRAFAPHYARPAVAAFWWPRFTAIASRVIAWETERRPLCREVVSERRGQLSLGCAENSFELVARADRIELRQDGTLALIDYKTGAIPAPRNIQAGLDPQLPLEAAIANGGGFKDITAKVSALEFWPLSGRGSAAKIKPVPLETVETALAGLKALIQLFDHVDTAYLATPRAALKLRFNDYAHLERLKEWGDEEEA